jgi:hypothetical protein
LEKGLRSLSRERDTPVAASRIPRSKCERDTPVETHDLNEREAHTPVVELEREPFTPV